MHKKYIVMIPKASTEHPGKHGVTINSTMHPTKCALLLMEISEGFLYSRERKLKDCYWTETPKAP